MAAGIDDLVPSEPAVLTPSLRLVPDGRVILTVIAGGQHRRLVLDLDQVASLMGDVVRLVLVAK